MSINLSREDHNALVEIIAFLPNLIEAAGRNALLADAFVGYRTAKRMIARINFSGDVTVFTTQMINHLTTFGQIKRDVEALGVLLKHIADPDLLIVGFEDQAFLQKLIIGYQMLPNIPTKEALAASEPEESSESTTSGGSESDDCYVFLSYARPNADVADAVGKALAAANFNYFHDIKDIQSGDMWSQKIEDGLRKASRMVLLLSKASMPYRKEVEREWFYFDMKGKPIHTLLVEDCDINSRLIQVNYIDARSDVNEAVQQLVAKLNQACKNT